MSELFIGLIGGSGLYEMDDLTQIEERVVETPFGSPSDAITLGEIGVHSGEHDRVRLAFLSRHGRGHRQNPSDINYRANIHAMKQLGVDCIVSVSAVGSMREHLPPGHLVMVDQFIDRTVGRPRTFFDEGIAAHVPFADPVSRVLQEALHASAKSCDIPAQLGGTYICIEGPQFSTRAESRLFRTWDVDVIGMTNLPEARLAREAEIPYATIALVTDFDCWHEGHDDVTVDAVVATMRENVVRAKKTIRCLVQHIDPEALRSEAGICDALQHAVMTDPNTLDAATRERVALLMRPYWGE